MAWLHEDSQCVSLLEKQCHEKDALITQLYHQLGALQQQQQQQYASDASIMMCPAKETSNADVGQKLMHLEREVVAKRLEVEEIRTKVCH